MGKIQLNLGIDLTDSQLVHLVRIAEVNNTTPTDYLVMAVQTALSMAETQYKNLRAGEPGLKMVPRDQPIQLAICEKCGRSFEFLKGQGPEKFVSCEDHSMVVSRDEAETIEEAALRRWKEEKEKGKGDGSAS